MKLVLAKCLKTYPEEDHMVEYCDGHREPCDVKINYKGREYFVSEKGHDERYFEVIDPRVYKQNP